MVWESGGKMRGQFRKLTDVLNLGKYSNKNVGEKLCPQLK
jgi:hypothetical protein